MGGGAKFLKICALYAAYCCDMAGRWLKRIFGKNAKKETQDEV